jgi:hypothetical protein
LLVPSILNVLLDVFKWSAFVQLDDGVLGGVT